VTVDHVLKQIELLSVVLEATPDGGLKVKPLSKVPDELRAKIRELKPDILEVLRRAALFRGQVDEWAANGRVGVPVLALPGHGADSNGACKSCGAPSPRWIWCDICAAATRMALGGQR
jgi:hypothetical protein